MSSSFEIPDSISFGDLEKLQADAPKEEVKDGPFAGYHREGVESLVEAKLQELMEACPHPIAHKVAMFDIIDHMISWHQTAAEQMAEDGELRQAAGWLQDAGKLQAMANVLQTISVCREDFTCE